MRGLLSLFGVACLLVAAVVQGSPAVAQASVESDELPFDFRVMITPEIPFVVVETPEGPIEIWREQDPEARLGGDWARVARPCPPFCIQPISPAPGVTTIGELELLDLLQDPDAIVIDSRTVEWWRDGTIPGAVHIPYNEIVDRLDELGCEPEFEGWDCSEARRVALFCNGPWCGQSPSAIRFMISAGYPAGRIFYYRGGMQVWRLLGFRVIRP